MKYPRKTPAKRFNIDKQIDFRIIVRVKKGPTVGSS